MPETRPLRVFLCHASQDKPAVRKLYSQLKSQTWVDPWLDEEKLLPGMDWDLEIFKAIRDADVILVCLSNESVSKEGYVQREFKRALYLAEEKPEGTIYVIPLRLDDCVPPSKFNKWQWLDYFAMDAHEKLLKSLRLRAGTLQAQDAASPANTGLAGSQTQGSVIASPASKKTPGGHPLYIFGGLEFVKVSAGDFYMGADDINAYEDAAKPQHLVYKLDYDFYIARFPLTNRQYGRIARESGKPMIVSKGNANHPVVNVSWYGAQKYIAWLNQNYAAELPEGYRFCLPSEAEWEKAARGPDGNEYPWGDQFDKTKCNTIEGEKGVTTPVGAYSPGGDSPYGAADMTGNVWEWTRSLWGKNHSKPYFKYPYRFDDGREDENAGRSILRVLRGGSFIDYEANARCAYRYHRGFGNLYSSNGFRVAVSLAK